MTNLVILKIFFNFLQNYVTERGKSKQVKKIATTDAFAFKHMGNPYLF